MATAMVPEHLAQKSWHRPFINWQLDFRKSFFIIFKTTKIIPIRNVPRKDVKNISLSLSLHFSAAHQDFSAEAWELQITHQKLGR